MRHFTKRHNRTMTAWNSGNSTTCSFSIRANVLELLALLPVVYHLLLEGSTKDESANGNCLHNANFACSLEKGLDFQSKMKIPPSLVCSQCFL